MVKNHVSFKMVFGYNAIRRTTYQSWSPVYRQLLLRRAHQQLRNHYRRKVQVPHLFKQQLKLRVQMSKYGVTCRLTQPKTKNPINVWTMSRYGATRHFPKHLNGCKNSESILWMERVPEHRDSHASSSHEPSLEPQR